MDGQDWHPQVQPSPSNRLPTEAQGPRPTLGMGTLTRRRAGDNPDFAKSPHLPVGHSSSRGIWLPRSHVRNTGTPCVETHTEGSTPQASNASAALFRGEKTTEDARLPVLWVARDSRPPAGPTRPYTVGPIISSIPQLRNSEPRQSLSSLSDFIRHKGAFPSIIWFDPHRGRRPRRGKPTRPRSHSR